jgi:hypothetical protein
MSDDILSEDLDFLRDLIGQTQAGKVVWEEAEGHEFVSRRARVTAMIRRDSGQRGTPSRIRLALSRRGQIGDARVLAQRIDDAAPRPRDLELNALLALLWQLVAGEGTVATGLYDDFLGDQEQ